MLIDDCNYLYSYEIFLYSLIPTYLLNLIYSFEYTFLQLKAFSYNIFMHDAELILLMSSPFVTLCVVQASGKVVGDQENL